MQLRFDKRLFDVHERVMLFDDDFSALGSVSKISNLSTSLVAADIAVRLPRDLAKERKLLLALPLSSRPIYPNENLGLANPISLEVTVGPQKTLRASWSPKLVRSPVSPWGIELAARWAQLDSTGASAKSGYSVPWSIFCTSVGPGAVPAGATITVEVDRRLVSALEVASTIFPPPADGKPEYATSVSEVRGAQRLQIVLLRPIAAGETVQVFLSTTPSDSLRRDSRGASVSVSARAEGSRIVRSTGLTELFAPIPSAGSAG